MKTYQVKSNDPSVKEILTKLKGNGNKGKVAAKAEVKTVKVEAKNQHIPSPIFSRFFISATQS